MVEPGRCLTAIHDEPGWRGCREALGVVVRREHLRSTIPVGLVVGTVLFCINHLDVVLAGHATATTWVKAGVTYFVPFIVANLGVLTATRTGDPERHVAGTGKLAASRAGRREPHERAITTVGTHSAPGREQGRSR